MPKFHCRLILFLLTVILLIIFSSGLAFWYLIIYPNSLIKGNGNITTEKRELTKFMKLNISDTFKVNITQGTEDENLEVLAEENIIKNIKTEVRGDTLYINYEKYGLLGLGVIAPTKDITINLNYKDISEINLSGSIDLETQNKLRTDKLNIVQSKSTKVVMDIFTNVLIVNTAGSGQFDIEGSATKQEVDVSGAVSYDAKNLDSKEVKLNISGSGATKLRADDSLEVNISGSGSLEYYGNPKKFTQNISGVGTVRQGIE